MIRKLFVLALTLWLGACAGFQAAVTSPGEAGIPADHAVIIMGNRTEVPVNGPVVESGWETEENDGAKHFRVKESGLHYFAIPAGLYRWRFSLGPGVLSGRGLPRRESDLMFHVRPGERVYVGTMAYSVVPRAFLAKTLRDEWEAAQVMYRRDAGPGAPPLIKRLMRYRDVACGDDPFDSLPPIVTDLRLSPKQRCPDLY